MRTFRKGLKILLITVLVLGILGICTVGGLNAVVMGTTRGQILSPEEAAQLEDVDCILVLGCGVWAGGVPSHMLEDRLKRGIALYEAGAAPKLLMSGDHGTVGYNEVGVMKDFAMAAGVPSSDIFMDHAGFSTYESLYRARDVFCAKKIIIVSQDYHLYRGLYIAEALGLEAYGVNADYRAYAGQTMREIREVLARCKDFASTIFLPEPTYLGQQIPISGDGNATND